MHYVRFLRPPALSSERTQASVHVTFTITTDLGDAFLNPEKPIKLKLGIYNVSADAGGRKVPHSEILASKILDWLPGTRVVKTEIILQPLPASSDRFRVFVFPTAQAWGGSTWDVVSSLRKEDRGRIAPVWADVPSPADRDLGHVSLRRLRVGNEDSPLCFEVEEDIGESIARHIWDAGIAVTSILLENAALSTTNPPLPKLSQLLSSDQPIHVLELGCGVGILGLGIATILRQGSRHKTSRVLLTDLPDAQERAQANIQRWGQSFSSTDDVVQLSFEGLDWEDGRRGQLGPKGGARLWHLVALSDCTYNVDMLPALVGTLSALHDANLKHQASSSTPHGTRVLLATKPRHSSEAALFDLMAAEGWSVAEREAWPLAAMGSSAETVELYLFER